HPSALRRAPNALYARFARFRSAHRPRRFRDEAFGDSRRDTKPTGSARGLRFSSPLYTHAPWFVRRGDPAAGRMRPASRRPLRPLARSRTRASRMTPEPLLAVSELARRFNVRRHDGTKAELRAVDGVSFTIARGEVLGLVGESGSGKTTVGQLILRVIEPSAGTITLDGVDISRLSASALRPYRRRMQIVFQDPFSSLNPRMTVGDAIGEPLTIHGLAKDAAERRTKVAELLRLVGLAADDAKKYPHAFSGGQRQRIGIARALASAPDLLVADEPVSALDVSIQAQVVNLLLDLQARLGLAMLFIAHDLAVVEHIANRIAVMYLGRIVEVAES